MLKDVFLLDCTLRDGGFVNDWNFGLHVIRDILYRLGKAKVDVIEVGFLDDRREYDPNRAIQPGTKYFHKMFENMKFSASMIVAMIDYGTCSIDNIEDRKDTSLDGIRVIFKKEDIDGALDYCSQLKEKGYQVFVQPVSITTYSDSEMESLVGRVNALAPYGMSMVDTYGLLMKKDLMHYFGIVNRNLDSFIRLGYHAHNNFQMAFSNCMELLEISGERKLLLDSSIYGMGKGAGNTNTEMLANCLNKWYGKNYDINEFLEIIDTDLMDVYRRQYWGYSLQYYLSAANDCHPTYVSYLLNKQTLAVKDINNILSRIEKEKSLTYHEDLIEKLYVDYQTNTIDDSRTYEFLKGRLSGKDVLVIAPGPSINAHRKEIDDYIRERSPIVFTVNFVNAEFKADYVFVSNTRRYGRFSDSYYLTDYSDVTVLATSNITAAEIPVDYYFNFSSLMLPYACIQDNSTLMLCNVLKKAGISKVALAGFDGFQIQGENYSDANLDIDIPVQKMRDMNLCTREYLEEFCKQIELDFITPSEYVR